MVPSGLGGFFGRDVCNERSYNGYVNDGGNERIVLIGENDDKFKFTFTGYSPVLESE